MEERKNIMIVGAGSNVGLALAKYFIQQKMRVFLVARNAKKLESIQKEKDVFIFECDFEKEYDFEEIFSEIKKMQIKLDGLVYCAGICNQTPIRCTSLLELQKMYQVNLFPYYEVCRIFAKAEYSNKGAAIVGVSSYAAVTKERGMALYSMTKESMNTQSKVMAKEFLKRKIRVNTIMPANIISKMGCDSNEWTEEEIKEVEKKQPLGAIPIENVVQVIAFLLSDAGMYITGENIAISGGYMF